MLWLLILRPPSLAPLYRFAVVALCSHFDFSHTAGLDLSICRCASSSAASTVAAWKKERKMKKQSNGHIYFLVHALAFLCFFSSSLFSLFPVHWHSVLWMFQFVWLDTRIMSFTCAAEQCSHEWSLLLCHWVSVPSHSLCLVGTCMLGVFLY